MMRRPVRSPRTSRLGGLAAVIGLGTSMCWGSCSVYDESLLTQGNLNPDSSMSGTNGSGAAGGTDGSGGSGAEDGGGTGGTAGTNGGTGAGGNAGDGAVCATTAGPWWGKTNMHGCQTTGVPNAVEDRPPMACDGNSIEPILFATSRIRLGTAKDDAQLTLDDTAFKDIGLDLDNSCTNSETCWVMPDGGSADAGDAASDGGPRGPLVNERACKPGLVNPADGNQCRDNALGEIMFFAASSPDIGARLGINEQHFNCAIHRGEFGIIIKVSEYNGRSDDPQVRVDIYTSLGQQNPPGWQCMNNGVLISDWQRYAEWAPTTHWKIARRSLALNDPGVGTELPRARFADPIAYVRGGYLVAKLPPATELWLNGNHPEAHVAGFRNVIFRATTLAKLVQATNGVWSMDQGIISGVTFPTDVVKALREVGFCQNFCGSYNQLIDIVNIAQDSLTTTDQRLQDTDCDGISMGISFSARQVRADRSDLVDSEPVECPHPKDPTLPRQGCVCQPGGSCVLPDAGRDGG
jgi:hypothetical protein